MDLNEIRLEINKVNDQMQELFNKRMELCNQVAEYKIKNNMPVFQGDREKEVIDHAIERSPEDLKGANRAFFQTVMDIGKCRQYQILFANEKTIDYKPLDLSGRHTVAVPGTNGSYNHIACSNLFEDFEPHFFEEFEEVFQAVENGEAEYGILPIVNSTAGSVAQTYDLMKKYDFKIIASTKLKISHCLAVKKGVKFEDIRSIYSHEQGLMQCSEFIQKHGFKTHKYSNTALAACYIKQSEKPYGAICSEDCAEELGLDIVSRGIANAEENYTKFILISKENYKSENADTILVSLVLPHQASSLYRLLTKFSVAGLNLQMIESMPVANTDFDVMFYLTFSGAIDSPDVARLMNELSEELSYFKFLGNYEEF